MTQVDMGALRHDMVDWDHATLTRRRVKTGESTAEVPTVTYPLWAETLGLLRACRSSHPELLLTTSTGTPLYVVEHRGGKVIKKDQVNCQWKRGKAAMPLQAFRSVAAKTLDGHAEYGRYVGHFLGHTPRSLKDRHYVSPSGEQFRDAMTWMRTVLLG